MNKVGQKASRFFIKATLTAITAVALYSLASNVFANGKENDLKSYWPKFPDETNTELQSNGNKKAQKEIKKQLLALTVMPKDTSKDTTKLQFPIKDETDPNTRFKSPLYMKTPSNVKTELVYNPITKTYELTNKIGSMNYRQPQGMTLDEYRNYDMQNSLQNYWKQKVQADRASKSNNSQGFSSFLNPKFNVPIEGFDKIFGSSTIDIKPQGKAELILGVNISTIENPILPKNMQNHVSFEFDEKIQMGVTGSIGDKLKVGINYNTEATFDFENTQKLAYTGKEDDIIKNIEVGNVTLPLAGTLITGSHALFGLKTELQFGKLNVTSVFSRQQGESQVIEVKKGAQTSSFKVNANDYEANRHFFLSQDFRDHYEEALASLPVLTSDINIVKIEVWVTNKTKNFDQARNIVSFQDLGEGYNPQGKANFDGPANFVQPTGGTYVDNARNNIYERISGLNTGIRNFPSITSTLQNISDLRPTRDYEKIEQARLLKAGEYTLNAKLGYISLNQSLNSDEILAVSYEYTVGGKVHKVGEFTTDFPAPNTLITKMLKSTNLNPKYKSWKLMMKNIYAMNAYQVNSSNFVMNIKYRNAATGTPIGYVPAGQIDKKLLLQVMNLDRLNSQMDHQPDGYFDFIDGITINASNGRIILPMLEPFGSFIKNKITGGDASLNSVADPYVFQELYDSTQTKAKQFAEKDKYFLEGSYQSASGSEINLNAPNVPQGSVKVTANGAVLQENIDYTVDYSLGRVTILNKALLESGTPIQIALENRPLFNMGTKTFLGTHLDYKFSDKFVIGGTLLNLSERPLTSKINVGDEPISNTIWGLNGTYTTNLPWLTRMLDKSGLVKTKEMSTITISGEFAQLIPGHNSLIGANGTSYIDDFEASQSTFDLLSPQAWTLASVPAKQPMLFPEASRNNDLSYGFNRAKLAWFSISSDLQRAITGLPGINNDSLSNHFVREVYAQNIWPNKSQINGIPETVRTLNLSYYPSERGPYNYETGTSDISAGINSKGYLNKPESRWAGIMRRLSYNDFEAMNVGYIEFWVMDPFVYDKNYRGGKLYFNLGDVSEDILKDSRKAFEQGLPTSSPPTLVDSTQWGRVPVIQSLVPAFDNNPDKLRIQDIGLDGLNDTDEKSFFSSDNRKDFGHKPYYFIDNIKAGNYDQNAKSIKKALNDPSSDDYHYFLGQDYDSLKLGILDRYKDFNGMEGNSTPSISATGYPDWEDINQDNTLSENESYFQYAVDIAPDKMKIGQNNIVDIIEDTRARKNDQVTTVKWYQFRIPINENYTRIGDIQDFKSIRFMRMFLKGFDKNINLRFAKLGLVKSEWRKYTNSLLEATEMTNTKQPVDASFEVGAVNIEENGTKSPVNYVLPPGITRVIDPTQPQLVQLNEQAMMLKVHSLDDGDARATYKTMNLDARQYKKLQMFIHAEALPNTILKDNDLSLFVRIGSDFLENYYEYEIPLKLTLPNASYKDNDADRLAVWPEINNLDLEFSLLQQVKQARNVKMRTPGSTVSLTTPYIETRGGKRIKVMGNPNLAAVTAMMVGVRNPKQSSQTANSAADDGLPKSGEIWVNELRFTDFNESGGWAANARINAKLADFANITLAGNISTPGWGSLESKMNTRQKEQIMQYDLSTQADLGKIFPQRYGVKIPMFVGYSEGLSTPQYNPLDPDMNLKESLKGTSKHYQDSITNIVEEYTKRKSFNITNAKITPPPSKEKGAKEPTPSLLSISNFSTSYSFSEVYLRNINTEYNDALTYSGSLAYNYVNPSPRNLTPFKSIRALNSPYLALVKDFNFYFMPKQISVRTDINRTYQEIQMRDVYATGAIIPANYKKDFLWNRSYDLKFDLSKNIKIDFSATNYARIDEPDGKISSDTKDYKLKRDTIWSNIMSGGRTTQYQHKINATWTVPLNKIPMLAWINANLRYGGTYNWDTGPILEDKTRTLGNTIRNSNTQQATVAFNVQSLLSKVGFINQNMNKIKNNKKDEAKTQTVEFKQTSVKLKAFTRYVINHKLNTTDVSIKVVDENGKEVKGRSDNVANNRTEFFPDRDCAQANITATAKTVIKESITTEIGRHALFALTSLNNIMITYTNNNSTSLPGYLPRTKFVGMESYGSDLVPGLPFIMGMQNDNLPRYAASHGWLSTDDQLNTATAMMKNTTIKATASIEPFPNFRIDLDFSRNISSNQTEYWTATDGSKYINGHNKSITGGFSMTYNTIWTAFEKMDLNTYHSNTFDVFLGNRLTIANRLAAQRKGNNIPGDPNSKYDPNDRFNPTTGGNRTDKYPDGYGPLAQDVMIPAFLAAYSGQSPSKIGLTNFPLIPLPNWSIRYDGLTRLDLLKNLFKSIMFTHVYKSNYNVDNYSTDINYSDGTLDPTDGLSYVRNNLNNYFIPQFVIGSVNLNEQFMPLFGLDMTWKNNMTSRVEYRQSRQLILGFTDNKLQETHSTEFIVGTGFKFNNVEFQINTDGGGKKRFKSDINVRADFSIKDNFLINRNIDLDSTLNTQQIQNGQKVIAIKLSADYILSKEFTLRLFYDQTINEPKVSTSFRTSNTKVGFSLTFNFIP